METETLIGALARASGQVDRGRVLRSLLWCAGAAMLWCVIAVLLIAGLRPDAAGSADWIAIKAGVSLLFVACGAPLALRLAQPGRSAGVLGWISLVLFGIAGVVAGASIMTASPGVRVAEMSGGGFPHAVFIIPALAVPPGVALFLWLRNQAPTRLMQAGAAAGVLAGGMSATAYALHCPVDTPAFVALWYPMAIALCAAAGALAGRVALRW